MSRGSPRRDAMVKLLKLEPMGASALAEATGMGIQYVRSELCRMQARGMIEVMAQKKSHAGKRAMQVYAVVDESLWPLSVSQIKRNPNHISKLKPRERARSGSGVIAGPCISRQFVWNSNVGKML